MGIALRNAGFGLQFGAAGDVGENQVPDELGAGAGITPPPASPIVLDGFQPDTDRPAAPVIQEKPSEVVELTPEQKFEQACAVVSPIKKHFGKTLGEVLAQEPRAIKWLATSYSGDEQIKAAAEFICAYAVDQTSV